MKSILSSMAGVAVLLALSSVTNADRVFLTSPANDTDAYAGCNLELGFRVQYSDLAALGYVQLQVLDHEDKVLIDSIDNSTREEWDSVRSKNITWSIPDDWPEGDYTLRAFGDAYYTCKENGRRTFCPLLLEDKEIIHIKHSSDGKDCPSIPASISSPSTLPSPSLSQTHGSKHKNNKSTKSETSERENTTGSSEKSEIKVNLDNSAVKLLKKENSTSVPEGKSLNSNELGNSTNHSSQANGVSSDASKHKPLDSEATRSTGIGSMWVNINFSVSLAFAAALVTLV